MEQKAYKIFIIEDSDKDRELLENLNSATLL